MESRQAIIEFANLLTIGSGALKSIVQALEPATREPAKVYLAEVEAIAGRLSEIGGELERLG